MAGCQPKVGSPCSSRALPPGHLTQACKGCPATLYRFGLEQPRTFSRLLGKNRHDQVSQRLREHFEKYKVVNKSKVIVVLFILPESTSGIYLCKSENIWPCLMPGRTKMNYFSDPTRAFLYSPFVVVVIIYHSQAYCIELYTESSHF